MLKILLILLFTAFSLGQFSAVVKQGEANFYLFDLMTGIFSLYGTFYFLTFTKKFLFPKYLMLFVFFTLSAGVSYFLNLHKYSQNEILVAGFYLLRWFIYLLAGFVVFNMLKQKKLEVRHLFDIILYSGIFLSVAGFLQLLVLPDFETLDPGLGWDPHKNRLASTFFDPNFTGAYLSICIAIIFERFFSRINNFSTKTIKYPEIKKYFKIGELPAFLIILTAILLTFSRSTWLLLGVIVFIYGFFRSKKMLLLSLILVFCAYFVVPRIQTRISGITDPADSARFRLESWIDTTEIVKDNYIFGVGYNFMRYAKSDYGFLDPDKFLIHSGAGSDSSILFVIATTGLTGLVFFGVGLIFPVIEQYKELIKSEYLTNGTLLISVIAGLFLESQFINSLFFPQIMFLWLIILGVFSDRATNIV